MLRADANRRQRARARLRRWGVVCGGNRSPYRDWTLEYFGGSGSNGCLGRLGAGGQGDPLERRRVDARPRGNRSGAPGRSGVQGPNDVWAVSSPSQIFHTRGILNGSAQWSSATAIWDAWDLQRDTGIVRAVWGASPTDVWVGGSAGSSDLALHRSSMLGEVASPILGLTWAPVLTGTTGFTTLLRKSDMGERARRYLDGRVKAIWR